MDELHGFAHRPGARPGPHIARPPRPPVLVRQTRARGYLLGAAMLLLVPALLTVQCGTDGGARVRIEPLAAGTGGMAPAGAPRVAAPAGLRDRIEAALAEMTGTAARVVDDDGRAEVRVVPASAVDPDAPVARRWVVAAAAGRIDLDGVSRGALDAAARAGPLYVAADQADLVAPLFVERDGLRPIAAGTIAARLNAEPAALAIVPADTITVRVRALALDGIDPVRGEGDLGSYPLVTRVRVRAESSDRAAKELAAALTGALSQPPPAPLRVTFTGDLIPTRCVDGQIRRAGDWAAPFRQVADRLSAAAITVGSLDASLSDKGEPIGCRETFNLLADPRVVAGFRLAGYDVMTVAANHAKDCGSTGYCGSAAFLDTLANLRAAGIQPAGGGETLAEARRPAVMTAGSVRFAFLGYDDIAPYYHADESTPGTAGLDLDTLAGDVRAARAVADVVVVMPHWGVEYTADPTPRQRRAARIAVEAGAALVVGNHPHTVQAAAPDGDAYVAWALGNFVFDQDWSVETTQGVVLEATFVGSRLAAVRFLPVRIENRLTPVFLNPDEGRPILQRMMDAAARLRDGE